MNTQSFDEFVQNQQAPEGSPDSFDPDREKQEWLVYLDGLYHTVEEKLCNYIGDGRIQFEYRNHVISEDEVGEYGAKKLVLKLGRKRITFTPRGTFFIGMKGRVDVDGPGGQISLVLVDSKLKGAASLVRSEALNSGSNISLSFQVGSPGPITWEWKIVSGAPHRKFLELNQENLFDLIAELANA